ncbi:MAG: type II toxin-antitoxin system VapC family toxin [Candidatus Asgardarchaeia archaeon]
MERRIKGIVLDTDVFINLSKGNLLLKFLQKFDGYLTEISLYETLRGSQYYKKNIEKEKALIERMFEILKINNLVILKASVIWAELKKSGKIISDGDLLNATMAIIYDLHFSTNNVKHYQRFTKYGLKLLPWTQLKTMLE